MKSRNIRILFSDSEIEKFIGGFNLQSNQDPVISAGIAHLWFVTIHPFEDSNGRIARAITDMQLAKSDGISRRFYSMSSAINKQRKEYYEVLEKTQKGNLDITIWLEWFLNCLHYSLESSEEILEKVINKNKFWNINAGNLQNNRQKLMMNKMLDGFTGKLTSSKWAKITKCSQDTALRDIQDLLNKNILRKPESGGRSTSYELNNF